MEYRHKVPQHAFTIKSTGLANVLVMDVEITVVGNPAKGFKTKAIWDTGATNTVITKELIAALGINPTGITYVNTASENKRQTSTYLVDVKLKADLAITAIQVTEGVILSEHGIDCLLGMDIIALGDFSITNLDGHTWMSFRIPSQHKIDFVEKLKKEQGFIDQHLKAGKSFTQPCPCGSGKKFKNCHGVNLEKV